MFPPDCPIAIYHLPDFSGASLLRNIDNSVLTERPGTFGQEETVMKSILCAVLFLGVMSACAHEGDLDVDSTSQSINGATLPSQGWGDPGVTFTVNTTGSVTWCCATWYTPLAVQIGDAIDSVSVTVRDNGPANGHPDDGNTVLLVLVAQTSSGPVTLGSATTDGSGTQQTLTITLIRPHVVATGDSIIMRAISAPSVHPSMIGTITVRPPTTENPIFLIMPGSGFKPTTLNEKVLQISLVPGTVVLSASIAATCTTGWIITCARIREEPARSWCSAPTSCTNNASANAPMPPVTVDDTHHLDLALQFGPSATTPVTSVITVR